MLFRSADIEQRAKTKGVLEKRVELPVQDFQTLCKMAKASGKLQAENRSLWMQLQQSTVREQELGQRLRRCEEQLDAVLTETRPYREAVRVAPEQVLCGGGAAELIFRLAYALRPRRALITAPAFSEYEEALTAAGCAVTRHPLRRENRFDVDGGLLDVIAPGVELVFLCTPNNPTGRLVDGALLRAAAEQCRAVGAVLAVDECFLPLSDGAGPGLAPCLAEHPNLLLLRAFTKSYAMAGLRLGYALSANGGLLERMAAAGPPWSVSTPAQAAGLAALEQCSDWPEKARALLASERPALSDGLTALGLEVVPGQANYLLFRAAGAADLKERMLMRGVLIRSCANYHGLGNDWYRVCVGQAEQNRRLLAALKEVL